MYFADAGAAATPGGGGAKTGTTSAPISGSEVAKTSFAVVEVRTATSCGVTEIGDVQIDSTAQLVSVSAARHIVWHPALIESIAYFASLLDMPGIGISPACIQHLEAERSLPQVRWEQDAFAKAGWATRRKPTATATI